MHKGGKEMYTTLECKRCGKEMILLTEDVLKEDEVNCPYCRDDKVVVTGRYDCIKECIKNDDRKR